MSKYDKLQICAQISSFPRRWKDIKGHETQFETFDNGSEQAIKRRAQIDAVYNLFLGLFIQNGFINGQNKCRHCKRRTVDDFRDPKGRVERTSQSNDPKDKYPHWHFERNRTD